MKTNISRCLLAGILLSLFSLADVPAAKAQDGLYDKGHVQFGAQFGGTVSFFAGDTFTEATCGWRFDRKRYLGLGTGKMVVAVTDDDNPVNENGDVPAIPLYVNYVRYVPFRHFPQHSFTFTTQAGAGWFVDKLPLKDDNTRCFPIIRFAPGLEFRVWNRLSLSIGLHAQLSEACGLGLHTGIRF